MVSIKEDIINYIVYLIKIETGLDAIETTILIEDDADNFLRGDLKMKEFPIVVFYRYFDDEKTELSKRKFIYIDRKKYNSKLREIKIKYLEQCSNKEIN